jgi:hypothetical protein
MISLLLFLAGVAAGWSWRAEQDRPAKPHTYSPACFCDDCCEQADPLGKNAPDFALWGVFRVKGSKPPQLPRTRLLPL